MTMKATRLGSTPLMSIDAIALDTETTGLDTKIARLIQIGAIAVHEGEIDQESALDKLVNPGVPVPPETTRVHGIDDAMLAGQPGFSSVAGDLDALLQDRILIGHSIGFDIAILQREHELAGLTFKRPRSLCTAILAQIAFPDMPENSLEMLAARLGVEVIGRHTAIGDAMTTAAVFLAMAPQLRERNIRTLAEAEAACRKMTRVIDEQFKAGWAEPVADNRYTLNEQAMARLDAYPYRHSVADVMSAPPVTIRNKATLEEALKLLAEKRISALFVGEENDLHADSAGIITERDILRIIARDGAAAFKLPVGEHATRPLECVFDDAYLYRAIGRMTRRNIRHLAVKNDVDQIVGIVSQRDLLRMRATDAISLGDEIDTAPDARRLGAAWAKLPLIARGLFTEEASGKEIAGVVSRELGAMTRRACELALETMEKEGQGKPPVPFSLLVLGSGGRGESMLAPDQDNAIIYADTENVETVDAWFEQLGKRIADTLDDVGIPYCKGGIMASREEWRKPLSAWRAQVADWITRSNPQDLLNVDIFYDFRPVFGDVPLARELREHAFEAAAGQRAFSFALARQAGNYSPPINFFGGLKLKEGRVDLKASGLFPIISLARALAIKHGVRDRSTPARLAAIAESGHGEADLHRLIDVHGLLVERILDQQLDDIAQGLPPTNSIDPKVLTSRQAKQLREALSGLRNFDQLVQDLAS